MLQAKNLDIIRLISMLSHEQSGENSTIPTIAP